MQLDSILSPSRTLCGAPGASKKRIMENIAHFICEDFPSMNPNQLFDSLIARERLGSTGLGQGIAIPHCRIKNCSSIIGSLIKLEQAVDFDAIDGQPVDVMFVLLVPEQALDEHLNVLAKLAELFSDPKYCQQLRSATDSKSLFTIATAQH
ncbi:MAG: PTS IIA-like nitrogen regulatory protein PtsN [Pseudomonadales bacterium]